MTTQELRCSRHNLESTTHLILLLLSGIEGEFSPDEDSDPESKEVTGTLTSKYISGSVLFSGRVKSKRSSNAGWVWGQSSPSHFTFLSSGDEKLTIVIENDALVARTLDFLNRAGWEPV